MKVYLTTHELYPFYEVSDTDRYAEEYNIPEDKLAWIRHSINQIHEVLEYLEELGSVEVQQRRIDWEEERTRVIQKEREHATIQEIKDRLAEQLEKINQGSNPSKEDVGRTASSATPDKT